MESHVIYVVTLLLGLLATFSHGGPAMNAHGRLIETLTDDYSTIAPPRKNVNDSVDVSIVLSLFQLNEINEKSQYLQIVASLNLDWKDEYMTWDPTQYEGIKYTHIPSEMLWNPDVTLLNSVDDSEAAFDIGSFTEAKIDHKGHVKWMMPMMLRSSCVIEVSYYPFDRQVCKLKFISWTHNAYEINITTPIDEIVVDSYQKNPQWELITTSCEHKEMIYPCCKEPYSLVTCTLITERRPLFHIYNLVFPSFLLMLIGGLVFRVPPESGEKISLAVTVLLAITVYMMVVMDNVPENSTVVPLLQKFIGTTVVLLTLSTMLSVGLVKCQFQSYEDDRPSALTRKIVLGYIAKLVLFKAQKIEDETTPSEQQGSLLGKEKDIESPTHANGGNLKQHLGKELMPVDTTNLTPTDQHMLRIMSQQTEILRTIQEQAAYNQEESPEDRRAKMEWIRIVAILDRLFCGLYFIAVFIVVVIFLVAVYASKE